jgi:hypothetical protein
MPELHLYVSEERAARARERAQQMGMSLSRFLADVIRREVGVGWPERFFDEVVGGWKGQPLERPPQGDLEHRDTL